MKPERVTLTISVLIVLTFTSFLLHGWLNERRDPGPPEPVVRIGAIESTEAGYLVPFRVTNLGAQTAEEVQVVARLGEEQGEQRVDFLAHQEEVHGAFVFQQDPRQGSLVVRIASYRIP